MGAKIWLATGADHRGAEKLQQLQAQLSSHFPDLEIAPFSHARPGDNFNLPAARVTEAVLAREAEVKRGEATDDERQAFGLLICGSGHGMCMQANRYLGARAINAPSVESAREGRAHSDANILCLAADYLAVADMVEIVRAFLTTPFAGEPRFAERMRLLDQSPLLETDVLPELSAFPTHPGVTVGSVPAKNTVSVKNQERES